MLLKRSLFPNAKLPIKKRNIKEGNEKIDYWTLMFVSWYTKKLNNKGCSLFATGHAVD